MKKDGSYVGDEDIDALLAKCFEIMRTKGVDYALGSRDKLHNFKAAADFLGLTPEQAWAVYFYKHVSAVFSYAKNGGQTESEPIEGRLADLVVYTLLFYKMVRERKRAAERPIEKESGELDRLALKDELVGSSRHGCG